MGSPKEPSNQEKQLLALSRVLQALREANSADELMRLTLNYLRSTFAYSLVWIGQYDRVAHCLIGQGGISPIAHSAFLKQTFSLNPGDLLEQLVIQQRSLGLSDLREEPRAGEWQSLAKQLGIQGAALLPIRSRDRCWGVLLLGSPLWGISPRTEEKACLNMVLGGLGEALDRLEQAQLRQQAQRLNDPLLQLLTKLQPFPTLDRKLAAVVSEVQQLIRPSRTTVYWHDAELACFWRRASSRRSEASPDKIAVQDVAYFHQALLSDQLIAIGEAQSALKADVTGRLMQYLQARSLVAAPILFQNSLKGFLALEGEEPRLWTEAEKNYVRGAAQLLALSTPLEEQQATLQQIQQNQLLTAGLTQAIFSESDWQTALSRCAEQLCQRLQAKQFWLLYYNADRQRFQVHYQFNAAPPPTSRTKRPPAPELAELSRVDWQMLERSTEAIAIENLETDLKLLAWRSVLLSANLRSLLICPTTLHQSLEGVVLIGQEAPHRWSETDRGLLQVASQQVGLLLHQYHLQRQTDQLQKTYQAMQWGLTTLQQSLDLAQLEQVALQHFAELLNAPLVALLAWQPGQSGVQVSAAIVSQLGFELKLDSPLSLHTDLLLQAALQFDGLLTLTASDLSVETRQWLAGENIGQVLVMTLRTAPEHEPTGLVLIADRTDRRWSEVHLSALGTLVSQLSWCRRYLALTEELVHQRQSLQQLSWYKQRHLEELHRILAVGTRRLTELSQQKDPVAGLRFQQILRHLGSTVSTLSPILKQEQWRLAGEADVISLASLLKRSLERIDQVVKQRQLWLQVHNEASVSIVGEIIKLEFVLHEILLSACQRLPGGGRVDIWCRQIDATWLEISMTDNGVLEPRIFEEMQQGRSSDWLLPSVLDQSPGLEFAICQMLMRQLGGEFTLCQLDDGRTLSRMIVPIAVGDLPHPAPRHEYEVSNFF